MTKNPYLNALAAVAYIVGIVLLINYGPVLVRNKPDTLLAPIAMLSLLVLSVSVMGYIFFFQPVMMYIEGHKREAIGFFTKTLMTFAGITVVVIAIAFSGFW
jgi:hypothetical protein